MSEHTVNKCFSGAMVDLQPEHVLFYGISRFFSVSPRKFHDATFIWSLQPCFTSFLTHYS